MSFEHGAFTIETSQEAGHVVVLPRGELDLATAPELEELVLGLMADGVSVVLDLRGLSFMDSSGVRVLVAARARASDGGGELTIVRPERGGAVDRILEVSGIDQALELVDEPAT